MSHKLELVYPRKEKRQNFLATTKVIIVIAITHTKSPVMVLWSRAFEGVVTIKVTGTITKNMKALTSLKTSLGYLEAWR